MKSASTGAVVVILLVGLCARAPGQVVPVVPIVNQPAGVYVDADGTLHERQVDDKNELAAQRLRAKTLNQAASAASPQALTYVSLGKLIAELKSQTGAKRELPENVRFLGGLTQVRYVFVFPEEHDIVIAGASEPIESAGKTEPTGKVTGRPVMHLDDLVTALRMSASANGRAQPFGCSLDPHPDSLNRANQVMKDLARASRAERMKAMKEAIGPQQVRSFGAPDNSRLMFITIAADYKLKRMCLGLEPIPVAGVGSPVDNSRAAGNRFWFEADYAPLLVSPAGDAYELRGQRLALKCGAFSFDQKGATETSKRFAKDFSAKIPQLATIVPLFADLQNVADVSVLAALIRRDGLDRKAGLDLAWLLSDQNYQCAVVPTPKAAETLVNYTNGSLVAGGVALDPRRVVAESNRETDRKALVSAAKDRPGSDNWWKTRGGGVKVGAR